MVTIITHPPVIDILILGAGWTSTFLIPLLEKQHISYAATTTTGRDGTSKFKFDPDDSSTAQYRALPAARTILITFPLKGKGQSAHLVHAYAATHDPDRQYAFIQLGSTGIFSVPEQALWVTRHSAYDGTDDRAVAEDELRGLGGCVLNLSGLWGGARQAKHWLERVAATKEQLRGKTSLHMVHGLDVARGVVAVHGRFEKAAGQRFVLTDLLVYDWWALVLGFAGELDEELQSEDGAGRQIKWVGELMEERKVRALPRSMEDLGRCFDSREFWTTFGLMPVRSRI